MPAMKRPKWAKCNCGEKAVIRRWGQPVCRLCDQADRFRSGTFRPKARRGYAEAILARLKQQLMMNV